ncbi:Long-chain-fatty-acid--CoA ligase [Ruegeria sp. THAF57]|uniref:acyl-CoA synthetase n=1 Tax=Ruegeria sp. THAF57 TaxID=2744555 RepID=UPI0015DD9AD9|nr:acyl-CoA synthetase [Ruegeria sp. THAF57]CAD0187235.1 Long-chain-fatty-acid--CoA ligase [Ruegeria sp. THAF57]
MLDNINIQKARSLEAEMPWSARQEHKSIYHMLSSVAASAPDNKALSFQITSDPKDKVETLTYAELLAQVTQMANLFHELGVGKDDAVALILPNSNETVVATLAAMCVGIVNPINPLLEAEQISAILRETNAKVVVTLRRFPKTDLAQKAAKAVSFAPSVKTIVQVDLLHYLTPPKSWIAPLIRPKNPNHHHARILHWTKARKSQPSDRLLFEDTQEDRVAAYFHTGGTTGTPKVAQHRVSGILYQGWALRQEILQPGENIICPLPMFHVMAAHPILQATLQTGSHFVMATPQGFRGEGVFENFWKLCERYQANFLVMVPTAAAALLQHPVNADLSTMRFAACASSPMPLQLANRFEDATGITIIEAYGMTENTCVASVNPVDGSRKIGSVGVPTPYCDIKILDIAPDGSARRELGVDEIGEICIASPGAVPGETYLEADKNEGLFVMDKYLRTGDLGRIDSDGFIWITGRSKDLIIRGGHNIDPAEIEEALAAHPAVALVAAVGQPDKHAGELPCAFVQLVEGKTATTDELMTFAKQHIHEKAAVPKHLDILAEMPTTNVGKIFKPDLRKAAVTRIFDHTFAEAGLKARVVDVTDDKKLGLVAAIELASPDDEARVGEVLAGFIPKWRIT